MITEIRSTEVTDLLTTLARHRGFLRFAVRGLTDEQARQRPTVSALSLGGLVKHVATTERQWVDFAVRGAAAMWADAADGEIDEETAARWASGFELLPEETLEGVLAEYEAVAARTDEIIAAADLDTAHKLPEAPWFEPGASWTVRRVVLHLIAETSQHAGHADILRESIDGQKTMG
jgi:uncharacterized damage-inducible protein DinB